jgi:hypothetical protein
MTFSIPNRQKAKKDLLLQEAVRSRVKPSYLLNQDPPLRRRGGMLWNATLRLRKNRISLRAKLTGTLLGVGIFPGERSLTPKMSFHEYQVSPLLRLTSRHRYDPPPLLIRVTIIFLHACYWEHVQPRRVFGCAQRLPRIVYPNKLTIESHKLPDLQMEVK